jgi:hypothetical protein
LSSATCSANPAAGVQISRFDVFLRAGSASGLRSCSIATALPAA